MEPMSDSTLFDVLQRTDASPRGDLEDDFHFLNRVAGDYWGQIRDLIGSWFARYPREHQSDLRSRFRSGGHGLWGAYWELLLHELLHITDVLVSVQPELRDGTTPDYLIELGGELVLVEARVQMEPFDSAAEARAIGVVRDALSSLRTSDFWIDLEINRYGSSAPPARRIEQEAQSWVDSLSWDEVRVLRERGLDRATAKTLQVAGWEIELTAIARGPDHRHETIGVHMGPAQGRLVDDHEAVRKSLTKKVRKYRGSGHKILPAISNLRWTAGRTELVTALYGAAWEHPEMLSDRTILPSWRNVPEGLWVTRSGPQYSDAIGVLNGIEIWPWSLSTSQVAIYHRPDDDRILYALPFQHVFVGADGNLTSSDPERTVCEILGLATPWPAGDPFP